MIILLVCLKLSLHYYFEKYFRINKRIDYKYWLLFFLFFISFYIFILMLKKKKYILFFFSIYHFFIILLNLMGDEFSAVKFTSHQKYNQSNFEWILSVFISYSGCHVRRDAEKFSVQPEKNT